MLLLFLGPDSWWRTHTGGQAQACLALQPGHARVLVWTCELNYSAALWKRCWLVLEIPDQVPGPAGFVNTPVVGAGSPCPVWQLVSRSLLRCTAGTGLACASVAGPGFSDSSRCPFGGLAISELLPRIAPAFLPSRSAPAK